MSYIKALLINLQFFTIIPIRKDLPMDQKHISISVGFFPILGLLLGLIYAFFASVLINMTPLSTLSIAFIIWLSMIVLTGGIHLDGWMDTSDAYFSYQNREKRLEIMKDPRTGAFGVISLLILLSAKFLFIYESVVNQNELFISMLVLIPIYSRLFMGVVLVNIKSSKEEGLAFFFKKNCRSYTNHFYFLFIIILLTTIYFGNPDIFFISLILLIVILLFFLILYRKIKHWFGGITGDVLGATVEGGELLLWMIVWLWQYTAMG
ncbi:adenosylcobinamide-GDP ribazoletransferase [Bacillus pakistanensis]|uniref:Adenosylcobinamide-GDP ribazoletransferase n=1 Tax=Rossellomorea pakistanensis TaxID=992288 RepID=A0ABS2N7N5_9BACI|nr:adenosylcobinamide-GDP ribazoletransferase [Bacillus pakistanensis]MBM7583839.1 adenosylcobinamide-GDP ribazoletransferase [Bacillus pakistanensis]